MREQLLADVDRMWINGTIESYERDAMYYNICLAFDALTENKED